MKVLIAFASKFGNTQELALAIARGVGKSGQCEVTLKKLNTKSESECNPNEFDLIFLGTPLEFSIGREVWEVAEKVEKESKVALFGVGMSKRGSSNLQRLEKQLSGNSVKVIETLFIKKNPFLDDLRKLKELDLLRGEGFGEKLVAKLLGISTKKLKGKEGIRNYKR